MTGSWLELVIKETQSHRCPLLPCEDTGRCHQMQPERGSSPGPLRAAPRSRTPSLQSCGNKCLLFTSRPVSDTSVQQPDQTETLRTPGVDEKPQNPSVTWNPSTHVCSRWLSYNSPTFAPAADKDPFVKAEENEIINKAPKARCDLSRSLPHLVHLNLFE